MIVNGYKFDVLEVFDNPITVPDCFVLNPNKIGHGNGEAKLYISSKDSMREFFGNATSIPCFLLKQDLLNYLNTLKNEYMKPTQLYRMGADMPRLWKERYAMVERLDDIIYFNVTDQIQIAGPRGYVNSRDLGYKLIRELSLPLVSYLQMMMVRGKDNKVYCYWKLFVDFNLLSETNKNGATVLNYGKLKNEHGETAVKPHELKRIATVRIGQDRYREALLLECPYCPITMLNDERLLIASHIKPWAVSTAKEKIDPKNGFMLSPLYDALFDKGFITFTDDKKMLVSEFLSPKNIKRLNLDHGHYYPHLPIENKRMEYLAYHRASVFKSAGTVFDCV